MEDFDINSFKTVVINTIANNDDIVYLLDSEHVGSGGGLLYTKIFPYLQNPKTVETTAPFICFKVDHTKNANCFIEQIDVVIYVTCHEKEISKRVFNYTEQKYVSGTVIDVIGEYLKQELSGMDTGWIGELSCTGNVEEVLYYEYPCRKLTFSAYKENYAHNC